MQKFRVVKTSTWLPETECEVKVVLNATFRIENETFEIELPAGCTLMSNVICFSESPEGWLEPIS